MRIKEHVTLFFPHPFIVIFNVVERLRDNILLSLILYSSYKQSLHPQALFFLYFEVDELLKVAFLPLTWVDSSEKAK